MVYYCWSIEFFKDYILKSGSVHMGVWGVAILSEDIAHDYYKQKRGENNEKCRREAVPYWCT